MREKHGAKRSKGGSQGIDDVARECASDVEAG